MLGCFMLVCGFFQPVAQLPAPVWRYGLITNNGVGSGAIPGKMKVRPLEATMARGAKHLFLTNLYWPRTGGGMA